MGRANKVRKSKNIEIADEDTQKQICGFIAFLTSVVFCTSVFLHNISFFEKKMLTVLKNIV